MRLRTFLAVLLLFSMAALGTACGTHAHEPVEVDELTHRCAICNMAVTDDRHAVQIIAKDGQPLLFDDLGCMYAWIAQHGNDSIGAAFVRDYHDLTWLKMEEAYYVYDAAIRTPMAYGVISFADEQAARSFIAEHGSGTLLTADDLAEHTWESDHEHAHDHGHDQGEEQHHDEPHDHAEPGDNEQEHHDPQGAGHGA